MCVELLCVRLASAMQESERLKRAADADRSTQPERLTQLLTDMTNDRDKVLQKHFYPM